LFFAGDLTEKFGEKTHHFPMFVVVYVVVEFPLGLLMEVAQFFASGVVF